MKPKRVLITGGAGFIGSKLARAWAELGADVIVLDSLRSGDRANLTDVQHRFVEGDVRDAGVVRDAMEGCEVVHHLAAMVSVPESMENPQEAEAINTGGTIAVLEAAKRAQAKKVVFSSSCAVYGFADRPSHTEADAPEPASPYAISKLAGEGYMQLFARDFSVPTVSLRYFNVYGPGQDPNSAYAAAVAAFAARAASGEPLTIYGDGEQTRDFIFVEDIVAANIAAASSGDGVYNVGCGERLTINKLARQIVKLADSDSEIVHADPRPGDVRHSRADTSRIAADLEWKPKVSLEDGLRQTLVSFGMKVAGGN